MGRKEKETTGKRREEGKNGSSLAAATMASDEAGDIFPLLSSQSAMEEAVWPGIGNWGLAP